MTSSSLLYELARTLAARGDHRSAIPLRKLAQAGFTSLEEVDNLSDWALLAIPGIGIRRLAAIRALTRSDWQPPSAQATEVMSWFLTAARLARRFLPLDVLTALISGDVPPPMDHPTTEKRLALDMFSQATHRALGHCPAEELGQVLRLTSNGRRAAGSPRLEPPDLDWLQSVEPRGPRGKGSDANALSEPTGRPDPARDSNHYAYQTEKRRQIVQEYWAARRNREVKNVEEWARSHFNICGKTLMSYVRQFPELQEEP